MKTDLKKAIRESGLKQNFIAKGVSITPNYLSMIIAGLRDAPEKVKQIYDFINSNKKAA